MKSILLLAVSFLILGCAKDNPSGSAILRETTGTIKGRIMDADSNGLFSQFVFIYGTSFFSSTDSTGTFIIYNVPEGSYGLSFDLPGPDSTILVQVHRGVTTDIGNVFMIANNYAYYGEYDLESFMVTSQDSLLYYDGSIYPGESIFLDLSTDSIRLSFTAMGYSAEEELRNVSVRILHRGAAIYDSLPPKGRVRTGLIHFAGNDTLTVILDDKARFIFYRINNLEYSNSHYVILTTGTARLNTCLTGYCGSHYIKINSTSYSISYNSYEALDWDIYFVNDSTLDTCFWGNPSPDWGKAGNTIDDPSFYGDYVSTSDYTGQTRTSFRSDEITANRLASGAYSIYVRFFDGPDSVLAALPILNIELGDEDVPLLDQFYQRNPDTLVRRGETWFAGRILLPERIFVPNTLPPAPAAVASLSKPRR